MDSDPENRVAVTAVINLDKLDALRQLDPAGSAGILKKLIGIFLVSAPEFVIKIEAAIQAGDHVGLVRTAHSLRSSAANVGAEKLFEICRLLEESDSHAQNNDMVSLLSRLQHEFRLVMKALQQLQQNL